ncbi:hypothetical protein I9753_001453 [Serratia marcescens]|nr:hypothetical protein [Serratia marcescens]MDP8630508.1 hypothetical protein [Serratia marcescens]MDP8749340.1 hypothetical protein [Serratia marcescens]MDP8763647.1 hypothetical protein [Serratia marcescens]
MKLVDDSGWRGARLQEFRAEIYSSLKSLLGTIIANIGHCYFLN